MACYVDEECDWSDSSLNARPPECLESTTPSIHRSSPPGSPDRHDDLFMADTDDCPLPISSPLPALTFNTGDTAIPSRAQRAQLGVHLNRREPSKDDYSNFALYQANQKVYEATVLKIFSAHALHPDRIARCFEDGQQQDGSNLADYLRSVVQNINSMADKMIYNAHSRAVNLLANDGRDGVPFLDVHSFNRSMFSDFCPENAIPIASRMSESWHRVSPSTTIVRMSSKQFPIGASSSPFEEIDEIGGVFDKAFSTISLPTGRVAKPPSRRKVRARPTRHETSLSQRNWLAFPSQALPNHPAARQATLSPVKRVPQNHSEVREAAVSQPDRVDSPVCNRWRSRLVQDHMRRLAEKWPKQQRIVVSRKKQKKSVASPTAAAPSRRHPSGSTTLELHQILPPGAYFEPREPNEKPAWRCGSRHAMGHYYNAGNRSACPGCFVNIKDSAKTEHMDFYLPTSSHFFQPAPDVVYKPSKSSGKARRSKHLSHNSIAKEAYWAAIGAGASAEEARHAGVAAVEAVLLRRAPKEPTPKPTPEPEPDLGPHPSGSTTMEHGQDLPECAYTEKNERHEEYAWRCDLNHALGRYYLAGDKRSCPGCGSNRNSESKKATMDFYIPPGAVVRQEAPGLSVWKPRKKKKMTRASSNKESYLYLTHNQKCSRKYFEAVEGGLKHDEAVTHAIQELELELEAEETQSVEPEVLTQTEATRASKKRPFDSESDVEDIQESGSSASIEPEIAARICFG